MRDGKKLSFIGVIICRTNKNSMLQLKYDWETDRSHTPHIIYPVNHKGIPEPFSCQQNAAML